MSVKAYREKNVMPFVERLKEIVKSLTIKCVNFMEQIKQLKVKITKQAEDIDFYKSKVHQQYVKLEQLQEKADDFERVKQYVVPLLNMSNQITYLTLKKVSSIYLYNYYQYLPSFAY